MTMGTTATQDDVSLERRVSATLECRDRLRALELEGSVAERRSAAAAHVMSWLAAAGLDAPDLQSIAEDVVGEVVGFGPLERLLGDPHITEIMVNDYADVWVECGGRLIRRRDVAFRDEAHVRLILDRLLRGSGRRIDEASPLVDVRLSGGGRLNAILPPISRGGPVLTIRRPAPEALTVPDLVRSGAVNRSMAAFLHAAVEGRANIVVTGAAGAGKTTLLAALANLVPRTERVVVVEDVAELAIDHPHVVYQQTRPAGSDGVAAVTVRDLVRNSLRMRPDRLIVGEVRGSEAADMIMAMHTGHAGSMATVHGDSPTDVVERLTAMLALAWPAVRETALRRWIASAVDLIVTCDRQPDGRRCVSTIAAVDGVDNDLVAVVDVLSVRADGAHAAAMPTRCLQRMRRRGVAFPIEVLAVEPRT